MGLVFLDKHKPGAILIGDGLRIVHALYPVILYFVLLALAAPRSLNFFLSGAVSHIIKAVFNVKAMRVADHSMRLETRPVIGPFRACAHH